MNKQLLRIVFVVLGVSAAARLPAQTVQFYGVDKRVNYLQTSAATPVVSPVMGDPDGKAYHLDISINGSSLNLLSAASVTIPGNTVYNMAPSTPGDFTDYGWGNTGTVHSFTTKSAMDTAFPNGTYTITMSATAVPLVLGPNDTYPAEIPTVTGGTWDGSGHYLVNAATGATINFNTFSNYTGTGYIQGTAYSIGTNSTISQLVTQTNINVTGAVTDPLATSFTINPNVMLPGRTYYAELTFGRLTGGDVAAVPGALGHADFEYLTGFLIKTLGGFADLNGDGSTDLILSNTSTGERYFWLMNGTAFSSGFSLGIVPTQWQIGGAGDFNGDGKTDLVWSNTSTGERYIWLMNGTTYSSSVFLGTVPIQWQIASAGDFNGDGKPDLVWTNTSTGERYIWLMNGTTFSSSVSLGTVPTQWQIAGAGDYNSDGKADLLWTNTSTGERYIWLMNGTTYSSSVFLGIVPTQWVAKD
jgi:hypothetical protein